MKILAFNGSPRKNRNTATLLKKALEGAETEGAKTELIHLYDIDYKGCKSCFACKKIGGKSYGECAMHDDLSHILKQTRKAAALIFGSPVYLGEVTGMMRCFLERLIYPYIVYDNEFTSLAPRKIPTGCIFTLGSDEERMKSVGYDRALQMIGTLMKMYFGSSETLLVNDTMQFDDYSKYVSSRFDPEAKALRRREVFPEDCRKAFEMGARLAEQAAASRGSEE
jgi:multimeric flavodoxin WrbA